MVYLKNLFSIFTRLYDQNHTGTQHCKFENESVRTDSFPIDKDIRNSYIDIEFISSLFKLVVQIRLYYG